LDLHESPAKWANLTLPMYLEGMGAWLEASDTAYRNQGQTAPETPSWSFLARMLLAASRYE